MYISYHIISYHIIYLFAVGIKPGAVARSEACPLGMQADPSSIPTSGTFFRGDMKNVSTAILPLPLIQEGQLSVTGEKCAVSTGKLPRRLAQEQCGKGN